MHIARHNDYDTSNYALRGAKTPLTLRRLVGVRPDGDGWERVWETTADLEKFRTMAKAKLPRKQRAAQAVRKVEISKVAMPEPKVREAVFARLQGKSALEVRVAELEGKIREMMGVR